jgi:hypothetical protein
MKRRQWIGTVTLAIAVSVALATTQRVSSAVAKPPPRPVPVKLQQSPAHWSETTLEAAASPQNKHVLAAGRPITVTGEVVDVSCYLQLGKRGEAHVACGSKCIAHGEPVGLVDAKGTLYMLFAEEHHPRRDGMVDIRKVFAPLLAKDVTVTGMVSDMRGVRGLYVQAAEIGGQAVPMDGK